MTFSAIDLFVRRRDANAVRRPLHLRFGPDDPVLGAFAEGAHRRLRHQDAAAFLHHDVPIVGQIESGKRRVGLGAVGGAGNVALLLRGGAGSGHHRRAGRARLEHAAWLENGSSAFRLQRAPAREGPVAEIGIGVVLEVETPVDPA